MNLLESAYGTTDKAEFYRGANERLYVSATWFEANSNIPTFANVPASEVNIVPRLHQGDEVRAPMFLLGKNMGLQPAVIVDSAFLPDAVLVGFAPWQTLDVADPVQAMFLSEVRCR